MGHAVNAVFVWSIARAFGGAVLLRIEDHDCRRSRESFDAGIRTDLAWLGLRADNAALGHPDALRQRGNESAYEDAVRDLSTRQLMYACQCSRRDIATVRSASESSTYLENFRMWSSQSSGRSFAGSMPGSKAISVACRAIRPLARPEIASTHAAISSSGRAA